MTPALEPGVTTVGILSPVWAMWSGNLEPPAGRDDQSKVSPPGGAAGPGRWCAVLTGPADGILPFCRVAF
jgi:hypothetical protein